MLKLREEAQPNPSKWAGRQLRTEMIMAILKSGRVECHLAITSKSMGIGYKKENPALHNTLANERLPCATEGGSESLKKHHSHVQRCAFTLE
jgi:hypothetical protein